VSPSVVVCAVRRTTCVCDVCAACAAGQSSQRRKTKTWRRPVRRSRRWPLGGGGRGPVKPGPPATVAGGKGAWPSGYRSRPSPPPVSRRLDTAQSDGRAPVAPRRFYNAHKYGAAAAIMCAGPSLIFSGFFHLAFYRKEHRNRSPPAAAAPLGRSASSSPAH